MVDGCLYTECSVDHYNDNKIKSDGTTYEEFYMWVKLGDDDIGKPIQWDIMINASPDVVIENGVFVHKVANDWEFRKFRVFGKQSCIMLKKINGNYFDETFVGNKPGIVLIKK